MEMLIRFQEVAILCSARVGRLPGPLTRWHLEHLKLFLWPGALVSPGVLRAAASDSVVFRFAARWMIAFRDTS